MHVGVGAQFERTPAAVQGPPPALGAHTREILKESGFSEEEVKELLEKEVVWVGREDEPPIVSSPAKRQSSKL